VAYVDATRPGTETFAAVTAAFASMSNALGLFDGQEQLTTELRKRANATFNLMESSSGSYEAAYPDVAQFWPSDAFELNDDKLLASALMLYLPEQGGPSNQTPAREDRDSTDRFQYESHA
jgi:hypothetical protein